MKFQASWLAPLEIGAPRRRGRAAVSQNHCQLSPRHEPDRALQQHGGAHDNALDDELFMDEPDGETSGAAMAEADDEAGDDDADDADDADDGVAEAAGRREVKWGLLPEGLQVAPKPDALNDSLKDKIIYMRWPTPHGWLVGTIKEKFTQATPRLYAKFNYRIKWFDGWENHKLSLDDYNSGPTAPYKSWVMLDKIILEAEA